MVIWSINWKQLSVGLICLISSKLQTYWILNKCNATSACLVINPIMVDCFPLLLHAGWSFIRLNDGPNIKLADLFKLVGTGLSRVCCLVIRGSTGGFLLLRYFSGIVSHPGFSRCHNMFLSSPHLWLIIGLIRDLYVPYVNSLMD